MKAVALLLLCSCAGTVQPASLPYVRIDRSLSGAVVSREGAEAIAARRRMDQAACDSRVTDCEGTNKILSARLLEQTKLASKNAWWATYSPVLLVAAIVAGLLGGVAAGRAK